jgi:hypothetical protein
MLVQCARPATKDAWCRIPAGIALPALSAFESQQWLERQRKRRSRPSYFLLTFTLPAEFRALAWRHQRTPLRLAVRVRLGDGEHLQPERPATAGAARCGGVLHTHSRRLDYHPHVHLAMPGAALDPDSASGATKPRGKGSGYLFNHRALAKVFRAKLLAGARREG